MVIELPLNDFVVKYEKLSSEALNYRNVRQMIPENLYRMLKNLIDRDIDQSLLSDILDTVYDCLGGRLNELNAIRFFKAAIKQKSTFGNSFT